jgi:hypothetical protein
MKKIDPISYDLWQRFVEPFVRGNIDRTTEMKTLFAGGPGPFHPHPVVQKIVKTEKSMKPLKLPTLSRQFYFEVCVDVYFSYAYRVWDGWYWNSCDSWWALFY